MLKELERIEQLEYALDGILNSSPYDLDGRCVYCSRHATVNHSTLCRFWVAGKIRNRELTAIVITKNAGKEQAVLQDAPESREVGQDATTHSGSHNVE